MEVEVHVCLFIPYIYLQELFKIIYFVTCFYEERLVFFIPLCITVCP